MTHRGLLCFSQATHWAFLPQPLHIFSTRDSIWHTGFRDGRAKGVPGSCADVPCGRWKPAGLCHAEPIVWAPSWATVSGSPTRISQLWSSERLSICYEADWFNEAVTVQTSGLIGKDSSTTLSHGSRLHHFHFTVFQWEITTQNYKHNEERKKGRKIHGWEEWPLSRDRAASLTRLGSKYHLVSLCREEYLRMPAPAPRDKRQ